MKSHPIVAGALAGCAATAPMTAVMELLHRYLPRHERYPLPPSEILSVLTRALGVRRHIDRQEHIALTLLAHFGYGAVAGALYGQLAPRSSAPPAVHGAIFGLGVWSVSYLGMLPALGVLRPATRHPARRNALMIAAHLVWGVGLGLMTEALARRDPA